MASIPKIKRNFILRSDVHYSESVRYRSEQIVVGEAKFEL